jgi:hypothetical protein
MEPQYLTIEVGVPGADIQTVASPVPVPPQVRQAEPVEIANAWAWEHHSWNVDVQKAEDVRPN